MQIDHAHILKGVAVAARRARSLSLICLVPAPVVSPRMLLLLFLLLAVLSRTYTSCLLPLLLRPLFFILTAWVVLREQGWQFSPRGWGSTPMGIGTGLVSPVGLARRAPKLETGSSFALWGTIGPRN